MAIKFTALLLAASIAAAPALAQTPASKAVPVSIASLAADGYEVKVITDVSPDEQKIIWPNDAVNPYIIVTWQKGTSLATCAMSMASWLNLSDATLANANLCKKI